MFQTKLQQLKIGLLDDPAQKSDACRVIIESLPDWFGIPSANKNYIQGIEAMDVFEAFVDDVCVGLLALKFHYQTTAEIWWMGVKPEFHRQGIGVELFHAAKKHAVKKDCEFLIVNTLSNRSDDIYYARTRCFYEKLNFLPFFQQEEDSHNPMMWMLLKL